MSPRPAWLPEQAPLPLSAGDTLIFWAVLLALLLITVTLVSFMAGWLWFQLGDSIERLFWSAMTALF
jgi:hypothetical protein